MHVPQDILNRYIERRKVDFKECIKNLNQGNYAELEKVGHQLKGNGETFGHPEISKIGKELELAAREANDHSLHRTLIDFREWLKQKIN